MNLFNDVIEIERNGRLWRLHFNRRYDPITLSMIAVGAGTGMQIAGTLKQGKQAEEISEARAAIDIQNAEAVREASVEKAKIQGERGRKLLEKQKSTAAAGNIRINVGSPLVIETETRAALAKDIGFSLEQGRVESDAFRASAAVERATGKAAKKRSKFAAIAQGLQGFATIAFMGAMAGAPKTPPGTVPGTGGLARIPTPDTLASGGVPFR